MEGEMSADVTPDTAADESGAESGDGVEGNGGEVVAKQPTKAQLKELGEQDLDAIVTLKVNGQVKKVPVREALKLAQLEQASHAKMQEAAQLKRQAQELVKFAKENPKGFFQQLGMDPYEFAEMTLAEKLELMQMSPEQKRLREAEEKLKKYEEQEKQDKEREEQEKLTRAEREQMAKLDQEIGEAFKESGLPKHPYYVQQMAALMLSAEKQGVDLSGRDAAAKVKERFATSVKEILESMDAEAIQGFLGDSVAKKLRELEVKRVTGNTAPTANSARPGHQPQAKKSSQPKKPLNEKEWREWYEKLKSGA